MIYAIGVVGKFLLFKHAVLMRGGMFPEAYVYYPREMRGTRDLCVGACI